MSEGSRLPGYYKLSIDERRRRLAERTGSEIDEIVAAVQAGGLDPSTADKVVENVIGTYGLPFGIVLNAQIDGVDRLVPAVVEEPSVIAAASNAAKMVRPLGGFETKTTDPVMIGQVQLYRVPDQRAAVARLRGSVGELLRIAERSIPDLVKHGGGPKGIEVRDLGDGDVVLHVLIDCRDAMGANTVNTVAEAIGPRAAELAGGRLGLRILSNLCDRRLVTVRCRARAGDLAPAGKQGRLDPATVVDAIVEASRFAEIDPYRATTHNKGIMNGIDAVVIASGNDFRAVEAGAHAYAARSGSYSPLAVWRREGDELVGKLEMPLALGTVGGTLRVHPAARLALRILGAETSKDLIAAVASVGLASNLAALRALATEGIQRGHMSLHARSVAATAGAVGDEVERVAAVLVESGEITPERAEAVLAGLRG